jgi:CO dehydrogenase maturation factor
MKISVCGKGGSGKSVIATLLAYEFKSRGYRVLVVDSDESNSGLFRMLGFTEPPIPLMEMVGGKKGLKDRMGRSSSAGKSETKAEILSLEKIRVSDIPPQYIKERDGLRLVNIGKILQALEGCACPMGVLSREFLGKLRLGKNEICIVDMEAGVEHFGRGVETSIDLVLVVVEPSFESLELAAKVKQLAVGSGVKNVRAIINKVSSTEMAGKLAAELVRRGVNIVGAIHANREIFEACMSGGSLETVIVGEVKEIVSNLLSKG